MQDPRPNLDWDPTRCKRCNLCVNICPVKNLSLTNDEIIEIAKCTRCNMCIRYCPDQALALKND